MPGVNTAVEVAAGRSNSAVRLSDGTVLIWGANDAGQLGRRAGVSVGEPATLEPLADTRGVALGLRHGLAMSQRGRVFGWGDSTEWQLGIPAYFDALGIGAPVALPNVAGVTGIAAGNWHSLMLSADGTVWAAGNRHALGLTQDAIAPAPLDGVTLAPNAWLTGDADQDGVPSWEEFLYGLDPLSRDSNGNGLSDLVDLRRGSESANPDDDGDGVPSAMERALGTDPFAADTDADGVADGADDYPLDPARTQKPAPDPNDTTPPVIILTQPTNARPVGGQ